MIWISHNRAGLGSNTVDYYFSQGDWLFRISAAWVLYSKSAHPNLRRDFEGGPVASEIELKNLIRAIFRIEAKRFTDGQLV
jgi:hypothetical protein